jgi:hypothetical protein
MKQPPWHPVNKCTIYIIKMSNQLSIQPGNTLQAVKTAADNELHEL